MLGNAEGVVMLLLSAHKVIQGDFTLGMLFAFSSYAAMFSGRVHGLINSLMGLRMLKLHRERIADIGLEDREVSADSKGRRIELRGGIRLRSLSFSYGEEEGSVPGCR